MSNFLKSLVFLFVSFQGFGQINFEAGYIIPKNGERVKCLIKNVDWFNSPNNFKYKISENGKILAGTLDDIDEFGIGSNLKFINRSVEIDTLGSNLENLTTDRIGKTVIKDLFLKVLIEGDHSLFLYRFGGENRFFYKRLDDELVSLVYRRYRIGINQIGENNLFRSQLLKTSDCAELGVSKFNSLKYEVPDLTKIVTKLNDCGNSTAKSYIESNASKKFGVQFFVGGILSKFEFDRFLTTTTEIGDPMSFGFVLGGEAHYNFSYHKNKWLFFTGVEYLNFKSENFYEVESFAIEEVEYTTELNYRCLDIPLGIRHKFYLPKKNKIIIDGALVSSISLDNSFVRVYNSVGSVDYRIETFSTKRLGRFGLGFEGDHLQVVLHYYSPRNIFAAQAVDGVLKSFSLKLNYIL